MVDWTPELVERVRTLWGEGVSATQIAKLIGQGATKNSIIGKAHRLKLAMRHKSPGPPRRKRRRHLKPSETKPRERPPQPPKATIPPNGIEAKPPPPKPQREPRLKPGTYTLLDLRPHQCKWPVNDPPRGSAAFLFCGEGRFNGHPYCEHHARVGFSGKGTARKAEVAGWQPRAPGF